MRLLLSLLCLLLATSLHAQQYDWDDFVEEYASDVERAEEEDLQLHLQELKELSEHPLNINTASIEDFLQLPFLSEKQIEQIHAYIYLHGQMQTLAELRLVPLIDDVTRRRLSLFVYAEPEQDKAKVKLFSHLRHDFSTRLDIPLYYRLGQQQENGYRGDALYHRMRYQIGNSRHFQAGLRVEKDAGERYYDSYGAYAMLHDVGILDRAVVGDYRIGFGEGLVLGGTTWNSKSTPPLKTQGGIRPMAGMDETNFLRGAAVTLALPKHLHLSAFGSYRKRDATLTSEGEVQTLRTDGYHRTASEWERRRNVGSAVLGGNISWYDKGFHFGNGKRAIGEELKHEDFRIRLFRMVAKASQKATFVFGGRRIIRPIYFLSIYGIIPVPISLPNDIALAVESYHNETIRIINPHTIRLSQTIGNV